MLIKKSLRIMLILFSIIPALIIGILTYSYVGDALLNSATDTLNYLSSSSSDQITSLFNSQFSELNVQCQKDIHKDMLSSLYFTEKGKYSHYTLNPEFLEFSLSKASTRYAFCCSYTMYDSDGCVIASSNRKFSTKSKEEIAALQNMDSSTTDLSSFLLDGSYFIDITKPIFSKKNILIGFVTSTIETSYFDYIVRLASLTQSGQAFLIDKNGVILHTQDQQLVNTSIHSDSIKELLRGTPSDKKSTATLHESYDGKKSIISLSSIPGTIWYVLLLQSNRDIVESANIILYCLIICSVVVFIIVCYVSSRISQYYTDPIFKLRNTMKLVSDGDFNVRCQINSKNELAELARSFNKMIQIIQSSYDDLSSMHEQLRDNEDEIRSNYDHIEYLAYHDLLTNLPNKLSFLEKLDTIFDQNKVSSLIHAIYFIDLDNFKTINDTLGHDYGDEILSSTGSRLSLLLGEQDMVARVGGDEFLIFKYNVETEANALDFAESLLFAFATPFILQTETIHISLSIGIAIYPWHGSTLKTLIKNADIAMYKSKITGKNRVSIFDTFMSEELNRNVEILDVLRGVIANKEVYLMYQPQVDVTTHAITGFESLMRINSQKLGMLSPMDFIPIAEESGLIIELGLWALEEACQFSKSLLDEGYPPRIVSVNISSIQLNRSGFVSSVNDILTKTGLPPSCLELEITESTLIDSIVDTITILHTLKNLGVRISLDDFGTGYSSLHYLTSLPITTLKIDKSFIDNICINKKDSAIAKSIIALAHEINVKVIAEGVEDKQQLGLLQSEECDTIQGFLFSRPLLPNDLITVLSKGIPF